MEIFTWGSQMILNTQLLCTCLVFFFFFFCSQRCLRTLVGQRPVPRREQSLRHFQQWSSVRSQGLPGVGFGILEHSVRILDFSIVPISVRRLGGRQFTKIYLRLCGLLAETWKSAQSLNVKDFEKPEGRTAFHRPKLRCIDCSPGLTWICTRCYDYKAQNAVASAQHKCSCSTSIFGNTVKPCPISFLKFRFHSHFTNSSSCYRVSNCNDSSCYGKSCLMSL